MSDISQCSNVAVRGSDPGTTTSTYSSSNPIATSNHTSSTNFTAITTQHKSNPTSPTTYTSTTTFTNNHRITPAEASRLSSQSIQTYLADPVHTIPYTPNPRSTHTSQLSAVAYSGYRMGTMLHDFDTAFNGSASSNGRGN